MTKENDLNLENKETKMSEKFLIRFGIICICFCMNSCNNSLSPPPVQKEDKNLISNSSFEEYGHATMQGWKFPDAPLLKFQKAAPPDGEFYSIVLKSRVDGAVVSTMAGAVPGDHDYRLSVWGKVTGLSGLMELYLQHNDSVKIRKSVPITSDKWVNYVVEDSLSAVEGDSLMVILSGTNPKTPQPYTWFDVCRLEVIK